MVARQVQVRLDDLQAAGGQAHVVAEEAAIEGGDATVLLDLLRVFVGDRDVRRGDERCHCERRRQWPQPADQLARRLAFESRRICNTAFPHCSRKSQPSQALVPGQPEKCGTVR
jgi:hypothetical protein